MRRVLHAATLAPCAARAAFVGCGYPSDPLASPEKMKVPPVLVVLAPHTHVQAQEAHAAVLPAMLVHTAMPPKRRFHILTAVQVGASRPYVHLQGDSAPADAEVCRGLACLASLLLPAACAASVLWWFLLRELKSDGRASRCFLSNVGLTQRSAPRPPRRRRLT